MKRILSILFVFLMMASAQAQVGGPAFGLLGKSGAGPFYYSDDTLQKPFYSSDDKTQQFSSADAGYVPPPPSNDITMTTTGFNAFWDAFVYSSGQTFPNSIVSPSDGSSQTAYDTWLGANGSAGGDDPTFSINKFAMAGAQFFSAKSSNPTFIANLQNTTAGNAWTYFTKVTTPNTITVDPPPSAAGTGYAINDHVTLALVDSGGHTVATVASVLKVTAINGGGGITAVAITTGGTYTKQPSGTVAVASTTGSGTGASFTISVAPTLNSVFGTATTSGDVGVNMRVDSGGNLKVDQYDGSTLHTVSGPTRLAMGTTYDIFITYDQVANKIGFSVDGKSIQTVTTNWTGSYSGTATHAFGLGGNASTGGFKYMPNSTAIYGMGFLNHAVSAPEVQAISAWMDAHYTSNVNPSAPAQQKSPVATGADGVINTAWDLPAANSAQITDYLQQYKLDSSGTWLTWSHTASPNLFGQITGVTNGLLYDFRVAAINSQGTGPVSNVVTATPNPLGATPYDISLFKLTLPVDANGNRSGNAQEINYSGSPDLATFADAWFTRTNNQITFKVPDGGADTSTTNFARTEFRNLTDIPNTTATCDTVKLSVDSIPNGDKVIVDQIHAPNNAPFKMIFLGGSAGTAKLYAITQPDKNGGNTTTDIKTGMTIGDVSVVQVCYTGTDLKFWLDGAATGSTTPPVASPNVDIAFNRLSLDPTNGTTYYWKRGAYFDNNLLAGVIVQVTHYLQTGTYHP